MENQVPKHNIKSFRIEGLFEDRNVEIPFERNQIILIGVNGLGKTTVLNSLYYTLTGQLSKLSTLVFYKIIIEFKSGKKVEIEKKDIELFDDVDRLRSRSELKIIDFINNILSVSEKALITENIGQEGFKWNEEISNIINQLALQLGYPNHFIKRTLTLMYSGKAGKIEEASRMILKEVNADILYFPTYRRIEEELNKLGTSEEIKIPFDDKRLIQFGMGDVTSTLNKVIDKIKSSAIVGFSRITGEMLSQYLKADPEKLESILTSQEIIKPDILKIILERVGSNIADEEKELIINLVETNALFDPNYTYLLNFLTKLIRIYDQQKDLDNSIKDFEKICNAYLIGKKVVYDESKVTINVVKENRLKDTLKENDIISLKNLSSGEKQIISLFTKIIFSDSNNIIVLFDEPELSLSMEWQMKLLPDITKSKKCKLLLSVTHSPFIFDNELDECATDMRTYISEYIPEN